VIPQYSEIAFVDTFIFNIRIQVTWMQSELLTLR
jgi:hypothetical protein